MRLLYLLIFISSSTSALDYDRRLDQIIKVYDLKPDSCHGKDTDANLANIGELIFNTDSLSGEKNIGCHSCHLEEFSFADNLPVAIGVGGSGSSTERVLSDGVLVPRNAFTLKGRGHPGFKSFFWDGKTEFINSTEFTSPFGLIDNGTYNSTLAVAASLPIIARDEFLGVDGIYSNKMLYQVDSAYFMDKFNSASEVLNRKIFHEYDNDLLKIKNEYMKLGVNEIDLADIGNALAEFIKRDFGCIDSKWNDYLSGDLKALSQNQKEGAILFYGAAKCSSCHSGELFSDFNYHSISAPQGSIGVSPLSQDFGRANITYRNEDRYKFRTPPLVFVSSTAPYGHSGQFKSLNDVVTYHLNPIKFLKDYKWTSDREMLQFGKVLSSRSDIFGYIDINKQEDVNKIVEFLHAL
ncbi:MAG: His-Xaa-Ser system-associated MauG-like protein [Colwellia sp.]|jgi:Cytochrome c peroxidase